MTHTTKLGVEVKSGWAWSWCIVDPAAASAKEQTLLHEMGHAAGAEHSDDELSPTTGGAVPRTDLMRKEGGRASPVTMRQETAQFLRGSYFCW